MPMASYSKNDVILVRYPYTDLTTAKVRPAVVIGAASVSQDIFVAPLTSQPPSPQMREFALTDWKVAGLNRPTALKRGVFTVHESLVIAKTGSLSTSDAADLETSLRSWLDLH